MRASGIAAVICADEHVVRRDVVAPIPARPVGGAQADHAPAAVHALRMSAPSTAVSNGPAKDMLAAPVHRGEQGLRILRRTSDAAAAPPMVANPRADAR